MATPTLRRPLLRRPVVQVLLVVGAVLVVVALSLFQPWKLFVDRQVNEPAPVATAPAAPAPPAAPSPSAASAPPAAPAPVDAVPPAQVTPAYPTEPAARAGPVVLARGEFVTHEHATSGSVVILALPDGSRVLRLENLDTSDGPLLKVWLTDAPVIEGSAGWYVFDDGNHVDLGELKGNVGSSNYPIPADADLTELTSVSIWCDRFSVSFGAAALS